MQWKWCRYLAFNTFKPTKMVCSWHGVSLALQSKSEIRIRKHIRERTLTVTCGVLDVWVTYDPCLYFAVNAKQIEWGTIAITTNLIYWRPRPWPPWWGWSSSQMPRTDAGIPQTGYLETWCNRPWAQCSRKILKEYRIKQFHHHSRSMSFTVNV